MFRNVIFAAAFLSCAITTGLLAQVSGRPRVGAPTAPPPEFDAATKNAFFDDAREQLVGQPATAAQVAAANAAPSSTAATTSPDASDSGAGWADIISATTIEDEVKAQLPILLEQVKSASVFKGGGYDEARVSFTYLSALFRVIQEYGGDVRWKSDSLGMGSVFARAGVNTKVGSDASFKEAKVRTEDLQTLIRGGNVETPAPDTDKTWAEIANRPPLMTRMDLAAVKRLKPWTSNANEFSAKRSEILREAESLAMMAHIIQHESYEYGDDDTYVGFAKQLEAQAKELIGAVKNDQAAEAASATSRINQTCDSCHEGYRA